MVDLSRPLRLKREVAERPVGVTATDLPVAQVWVDSGVFHLDHIFDYLVPESISSLVRTGIRVVVPFNGREVEALVISRALNSSTPSLKSVLKVLSPVPVATTSSLELIQEVSTRWGAHQFDVIRSAIPPRVAKAESDLLLQEKTSVTAEPRRTRGRSSKPIYRQLPPFREPLQLIASKVLKEKSGTTLVVVPDSKSRLRLSELLASRSPINLDSDLDRALRYRNYLLTGFTRDSVVIGTRSAIFAPISDLERIYIFDEGSEHLYERRTPGWNVRDVALIRTQLENVDLEFFGYSPSEEVARAIEEGEISYASTRGRVSVDSYPSETGELLPGRIIAKVRSSLKSGPVLFIAPRKGYSQSITCRKCRNISICHCGGKLIKTSAAADISCAHCEESYPHWQCAWCKNDIFYLLGRGADRFAYEIGAAFSGEKITVSTAEKSVDSYSSSDGIVIATPGAIPISPRGYSTVVILEAARFLSQSDMRAQERSRALFFSAVSHLSESGSLLLVLEHANPIIGALAAWKPSLMSSRELRERKEVALPPYSRAVTLDIEQSQSPTLVRGLKASVNDGRLPASTRILGPTEPRDGLSRILLLVEIERGQELIELIHEFQRKRSIAKKPLASLRIDPYSLSR
jgi:primosomal protein N' (replication factor Y)